MKRIRVDEVSERSVEHEAALSALRVSYRKHTGTWRYSWWMSNPVALLGYRAPTHVPGWEYSPYFDDVRRIRPS